MCLSALLLQDGIEHLHDETLLRLGQCADAFELLLQFRRWSAFAGAALIGSSVLSPFALAGALAISGAQTLARRTSTVFLVVSTALFGLIHGFGFANALIEVGLPTGRLIAGLAGFNIGVEIGQIMIAGSWWLLAGVALCHPRVAAEAQGLRQLAALALVALGAFWLVSRTF